MSELTKLSPSATNVGKLLANVSGAVLLIAMCSSRPVSASDASQPIVWIELGGAFTQLDSVQQNYLPPFTLRTSRSSFITDSPAEIEKSPPTSWDGNAKVVFEPNGMDWTFSAGILYGRSVRISSLRQQTALPSAASTYAGQYIAYQSIAAKNDESHLILDFRAGKDVGLGMLGIGGHSTISVGVRYAQLNSDSDINMLYQPTNDIRVYHKLFGTLEAERKFAGVGPSLSWDASAALVGDAASSSISFDWGVNGAALFGRQRVRGHHQTKELAVSYGYGVGVQKVPVYQISGPLNRSKQIVVPNLGGFAGVSWRYSGAKISFGYRADAYFGAMDGGIDTRKTYNRDFYGPFATVSVGLGG